MGGTGVKCYPLTMFLSFTLLGVSGLMTKGLSVEHMMGTWCASRVLVRPRNVIMLNLLNHNVHTQ